MMFQFRQLIVEYNPQKFSFRWRTTHNWSYNIFITAVMRRIMFGQNDWGFLEQRLA